MTQRNDLVDYSRPHFDFKKHLFLVVSEYCDKKCLYCYLSNDTKIKKQILSLGQVEFALKNFKKLDVGFITLVGGEPALLEDIFEITELIAKYKFKLIVQSNGSLNYEQLLHLRKISVLYVSVSLDSSLTNINDRFRYKGATFNALNCISMARWLNLPVRISTVISKNNVNEIYSLIQTAEENNVNLINIHRLENLDHHGEEINLESLTANEWLNQFKKWKDFSKNSRVNLRAPICFLTKHLAKELFIHNSDCPPKHFDTFNLIPNGNVYRCPLAKNEKIEAWNIFTDEIKITTAKDKYLFEENNYKCGSCPIIKNRNYKGFQNLIPVCPIVKTTLNNNSTVNNGIWDQIVNKMLEEI